jgi:hypothetical protein
LIDDASLRNLERLSAAETHERVDAKVFENGFMGFAHRLVSPKGVEPLFESSWKERIDIEQRVERVDEVLKSGISNTSRKLKQVIFESRISLAFYDVDERVVGAWQGLETSRGGFSPLLKRGLAGVVDRGQVQRRCPLIDRPGLVGLARHHVERESAFVQEGEKGGARRRLRGTQVVHH